MISRKVLLKKKYIDLYKIAPNPENPRKTKNNKELSGSIDEYGLQQPIIVRPIEEADDFHKDDYFFVVVDGDCRLHAMLTNPPEDTMLTVGNQVVIRNISKKDAFIQTIQANSLRQDFTIDEYCSIIEKLLEQKYSVRRIAEILGKSVGFVHERIDFISKASEEEKTEVLSGEKSLREWSRPEEVFAGEHLQSTSMNAVEEEAAEKEITKPPRFSVGGKTFLEFKDSFPNLSLINIFDTGSFVGFDIDFQNSDEEELVFEWLDFHKYPPAKVTEGDRTSKYYTRDFDHLIENGPGTNDLLLSKQIIGDSVTIIWKTEKTKDLMDLWIENNSIPFDDIISERIEELEEEPREENLKEAFMEISVLENQSLLASLKALVTEEEPLESGKIRLWFRSWNDTKLIDRYLEPSRFWTIPALDYPAATVLTTNLKDILIDEKQLKAHFEEVFQELTVIQKDTKKLNQISLRTIEEITLAAARLKVFSEEIFEDLKLLKSQRRISNGHVQHQKICQSCLQPKWLESKKTICSNCELNHRQQEKNNAAAASDSGGSL